MKTFLHSRCIMPGTYSAHKWRCLKSCPPCYLSVLVCTGAGKGWIKYLICHPAVTGRGGSWLQRSKCQLWCLYRALKSEKCLVWKDVWKTDLDNGQQLNSEYFLQLLPNRSPQNAQIVIFLAYILSNLFRNRLNYLAPCPSS